MLYLQRIQLFKDKKSIVGNNYGIGFHEVLDTGIDCAKWPRQYTCAHIFLVVYLPVHGFMQTHA
jgi:hypothetical protein